ncbi:hypothetical protein B296_00044535 [Ensete ventricosum]|uniref:Uncharacterized protein n=1 Tax=Ensete ventricosum TaxID=4639 RepID=A0A426YYY8_ENSVE|nr:hypothetical protein B296_00044535 [Ensete ventricosum]
MVGGGREGHGRRPPGRRAVNAPVLGCRGLDIGGMTPAEKSRPPMGGGKREREERGRERRGDGLGVADEEEKPWEWPDGRSILKWVGGETVLYLCPVPFTTHEGMRHQKRPHNFLCWAHTKTANRTVSFGIPDTHWIRM